MPTLSTSIVSIFWLPEMFLTLLVQGLCSTSLTKSGILDITFEVAYPPGDDAGPNSSVAPHFFLWIIGLSPQ